MFKGGKKRMIMAKVRDRSKVENVIIWSEEARLGAWSNIYIYIWMKWERGKTKVNVAGMEKRSLIPKRQPLTWFCLFSCTTEYWRGTTEGHSTLCPVLKLRGIFWGGWIPPFFEVPPLFLLPESQVLSYWVVFIAQSIVTKFYYILERFLVFNTSEWVWAVFMAMCILPLFWQHKIYSARHRWGAIIHIIVE